MERERSAEDSNRGERSLPWGENPRFRDFPLDEVSWIFCKQGFVDFYFSRFRGFLGLYQVV